MLAMQYALTEPTGLLSLIIESSPASMPQWVAEANKLRALLPAQVEETLRLHEEAGTTDDLAYVGAMLVFYQRHLCRLDPWPEYVQRSFEKLLGNPEVYNVMITSRLGEIAVPTLVLSGRYDEATPAIAETVHRGIKGSEWVLFEESSHMCHAEERARCMQVVSNFLHGVEVG
jgi:proline-specific peptidase